jgi:5-dehydro-2-deoxygluconokinase
VQGEDHHGQNARLKMLGEFCEQKGYKFLLEPLVIPTEKDLEPFGGDRKAYDLELRPQHFALAAQEFHADGVKPDVWKIEGTETTAGMDICSNAVFDGGKPNPEIIILGRGESAEKVDQWISVGAKSKGVTGFAVGRTIFAEPLMDMYAEKINERQATADIAKNFTHFIEVFERAQGE